MSKLPGKTTYSGRRRNSRQRSGFKSHPDSTGGEYKNEPTPVYLLKANEAASIVFDFGEVEGDVFVGFGGYFKCDSIVAVTIDNPNSKKNTLEHFALPNTSKFGSMWMNNNTNKQVTVTFLANEDSELALYGLICGSIWHDAFDSAIANQQHSYLKSMHTIMPEAAFIKKNGSIGVDIEMIDEAYIDIDLKSCNRCARFLPINLENERGHLSFSSHCVANAPCTHSGFGILKNLDFNDGENPPEFIKLHYGYQLECRFCKKYFVNMPLNRRRSAAQMKEDGQRRRNFELLIAEAYQNSKLLSYRQRTGKELTEDVWVKFGKKCFKCEKPIKTSNKMHLDHTRPLALLWPLDETATALCSTCNTSKRDKPPSEYYSEQELKNLAALTGLDVSELNCLEPNHEVIAEIIRREDWLFDEFLQKPELLKEKEGKITAELVVKALDKVLRRSLQKKYDYSFVEEYNKRRDASISLDDTEDFSSII